MSLSGEPMSAEDAAGQGQQALVQIGAAFVAQVRRCLWRQMGLVLSAAHSERQKIPTALFDHLGDLLAHAA